MNIRNIFDHQTDAMTLCKPVNQARVDGLITDPEMKPIVFGTTGSADV